MQDTVIWPCHNTPPKKDIRQIAENYKSVYQDAVMKYCRTIVYEHGTYKFFREYNWSA